MDLLYSLFFGAGVAAFAYTRVGRRIGYGNTQNETILVIAVFIIATLFFFSILHFFIHSA